MSEKDRDEFRRPQFHMRIKETEAGDLLLIAAGSDLLGGAIVVAPHNRKVFIEALQWAIKALEKVP